LNSNRQKKDYLELNRKLFLSNGIITKNEYKD